MSSTRRNGSARSGGSYDNYPTPEWAIERFLEVWEDLEHVGSRWLEPCVGDGVIVEVVDRFKPGIDWRVCELRDTRRSLRDAGLEKHQITIDDFFDAFPEPADDGHVKPFDVAIFNPPFSLTMQFVERCLKISKVVVCLQRLTFCGSDERNDFFVSKMPDVYVIPNRVSYTGDGRADSVEQAWHVFGPHELTEVGEMRVLATTPADVRRADFARCIAARGTRHGAVEDLFAEFE